MHAVQLPTSIPLSDLITTLNEQELTESQRTEHSVEFTLEEPEAHSIRIYGTTEEIHTLIANVAEWMINDAHTAILPFSDILFLLSNQEGQVIYRTIPIKETENLVSKINNIFEGASSQEELESIGYESNFSEFYWYFCEGTPNTQDGSIPPNLPFNKNIAKLYTILCSWVLANNPSTILDVTGNVGGLLAHAAEQADKSSNPQFVRLIDQEPETAIADSFSKLLYQGYGKKDVQTIPTKNHVEKLSQFSLDNYQQEEVPSKKYSAVFGLAFEQSSRTDKQVYQYLEQLIDSPHRFRVSSSIPTAIASLQKDGRGMLVVPRSAIISKYSMLEYFESIRLHAIIDFDTDIFNFEMIDSQFEYCIVLIEKSNRSDDSNLVRHISVSGLHSKLGQVLHARMEEVKDTQLDDVPLELKIVSQRDLIELPRRVMLQQPEYAPMFRSADFTSLNDLEELSLYQNINMIEKDVFYFSSSEVEKSPIDSSLFSPLIRREDIADADLFITSNDLDHYILDLSSAIDQIEVENGASNSETVLAELLNMGYNSAIEYLDSHLASKSAKWSRYWFCPIRPGTPETPDFVLAEFSPDTSWRRVTVDNAIIDQRCYGIECGDDTVATALHRILNTNGYNDLIETLTSSLGMGTVHYLRYQIDQIPIPQRALSKKFVRQTDHLFPPETRQDEISLQNVLLDLVNEDDSRDAFEILLEADDQFAWAWFLSLEEYEEFTLLWRKDNSLAKSYVAERVDRHTLETIDNLIEDSDLSQSRAEILRELLVEFNEAKYRLFLYGATPQFEGLIMDWVTKHDGKVRKTANDGYHISISTEHGEDSIRKSLTNLLEYYLRDGFGEFLLKNVKNDRNNITHGGLITNDEEQATMFLLCLHALCKRLFSQNQY